MVKKSTGIANLSCIATNIESNLGLKRDMFEVMNNGIDFLSTSQGDTGLPEQALKYFCVTVLPKNLHVMCVIRMCMPTMYLARGVAADQCYIGLLNFPWNLLFCLLRVDQEEGQRSGRRLRR